MGTLSGILEIGKRALLTNQEALGVIGHNIANVNTEGYSRQRANLEANTPMDNVNYGQLGTGVTIDSVTRARNALLDNQYREESSQLAQYEKQNEALTQIENIFNDPTDFGMASILSDFWNAWGDLANDPESYSARSQLRERAQILVDSFVSADDNLRLVETQLNEEYKTLVDKLNDLASQIAVLNKKIALAEGVGQNANDLRDQRDKKLDEMSEIADIKFSEQSNGAVNVYLDSKIFVQDFNAKELTTRTNSRNGVVYDDLIWKDSYDSVNLTSGKLKGIEIARDEEVEAIRVRLDELAENIVNEVNSRHSAGYGLNGSTGMNFFEDGIVNARDMALDQVIISDLDNIAAAQSNAPGDNSNALDMAELANLRVMNDETETFGDYYSSTLARIGTHKVSAESYVEEYKAVQQNIMNMRESVQGVVMDEELTEMIKFQRAYSAAANLIKVINELMAAVVRLGS
ncbi:MAG: flagellar hook-associated protein FlgK [Candidatus Marinimicrobia bacterium]|nr:flagellar hook-associated protein FlgK [Candidatus Neomarinimicrobiota bacterium]